VRADVNTHSTANIEEAKKIKTSIELESFHIDNFGEGRRNALTK
jgi:hypothetical protein